VLKVAERYPLTDQGWAAAWRSLVKLDPGTAGKVREVLYERANRDRVDHDQDRAADPGAGRRAVLPVSASYAGGPAHSALARARGHPAGQAHAAPAHGSIADELGRLAALADRGVLTREEFDQLKAKLIAER
jgi:hypothetical protein